MAVINNVKISKEISKANESVINENNNNNGSERKASAYQHGARNGENGGENNEI
jgi:hypothetical protein